MAVGGGIVVPLVLELGQAAGGQVAEDHGHVDVLLDRCPD